MRGVVAGSCNDVAQAGTELEAAAVERAVELVLVDVFIAVGTGAVRADVDLETHPPGDAGVLDHVRLPQRKQTAVDSRIAGPDVEGRVKKRAEMIEL